MPLNPLESAARGGLRTLVSMAGRKVTYSRDGAALTLTAIKMAVNTEADRGDGVVVESTRMDWVVEASKLIFGGRPVRPADGDRIEELTGGATYTYEVMSLGTDACYRQMGPHPGFWRIHSRLIGDDSE